MRKKLYLLMMLVWFATLQKSYGQSQEMQQLLLNIEKLAQFKSILSDMKKGYQILSGGYKTVKEMTQGTFSLHETFLDALLQVSPTVKNYQRVGSIVRGQVALVKLSKKALSQLVSEGVFSSKEMDYLEKVYGNVLELSLRNTEELFQILTAHNLRMNDEERLQAIDQIYLEMQDQLQFMQYFTNTSKVIVLQRHKALHDVNVLKSIY